MSLKDMELDDADYEKPVLSQPEQSKYPYGLCLHLDEITLKKLGIKDLPEVGKQLVIRAVAEVTSVSLNESHNGEVRSVGLQIQQMDISGAKKEVSADKIYDKNGNPGDEGPIGKMKVAKI